MKMIVAMSLFIMGMSTSYFCHRFQFSEDFNFCRFFPRFHFEWEENFHWEWEKAFEPFETEYGVFQIVYPEWVV